MTKGPLNVFVEQTNNWDTSKYPDFMAPYTDSVDENSSPAAFCRWGKKNGLAPGRQSKMSVFSANAIANIADGSPAATIAVVKAAKNQYSAEMETEEGTRVICTLNNGKFKAAEVSSAGRFMPVPSLPDKSFDLSPFYALFLMYLLDSNTIDPDVAALAQEAMETIKTSTDHDAVEMAIHYLNDTLITGFKTGELTTNVSNGKVSLLSEEIVKNGALNGEVICGKTKLINANRKNKQKKDISAKEAKAMFEDFADSHAWSQEEEELIPVFPDDYPVLPETIKIARRYVESRKAKRPMNNFLWRGITAYGKSTGVEMLAYILNIPLVRLTCSSTMERQDFLSEFIPEDAGCSNTAEMPSFMEISCDPEGAYEKLTGEYREGVSCDEVLDVYGKVCASSSGKDGGVHYKLIESTYITGLKRGYLVEVQEMSRIRDAGVLVSLNEYDRAGARIPLADGTFAKRHPDALVVYTDNVGYTSCRPVDPSVMRRMDCVLDSFELTDAQVKSRVLYNTGFKDMDRLNHMMKVWHKVIDYCHDNDITDGEISVNELERWANVLIIEGDDDYEEACIECVVAKASPDKATQDEIIEKVIKVVMSEAV